VVLGFFAATFFVAFLAEPRAWPRAGPLDELFFEGPAELFLRLDFVGIDFFVVDFFVGDFLVVMIGVHHFA